MFDALMRFVDTPAGFLVASLGIILLGITIYVLSMPLRPLCSCPRYNLRNQDGTTIIEKTFHRPDCEASNV